MITAIPCLARSGTDAPLPASELRFAVNAPGSYPYLYFDEGEGRYKGLIVDLMRSLEQDHPFSVRFIDSSQLRSERWLQEGKMDLMLGNPGWLQAPSQYLYSEPLAPHESYLYSMTPFEQEFSVQQLADKKVCTRKEFVYTGLTTLFANHQLQRVDASSQQAMASMLTRHRCDYAVLNNYNAQQIFAAMAPCPGTVYQSPRPTSSIDLSIVIRPELSAIKGLIDDKLHRSEGIAIQQKWLTDDGEAVSVKCAASNKKPAAAGPLPVFNKGHAD